MRSDTGAEGEKGPVLLVKAAGGGPGESVDIFGCASWGKPLVSAPS
jgi:hypothetical protein